MRKIVAIYLCLIALSLSLSSLGRTLHTPCAATEGSPRVELSASNAAHTELLVERAYNSNFEFASSGAAISTMPVQVVRTAQCITRLGIKCGVAASPDGCNVDFSGQFNTHIIVGVDKLDYYLFGRHQIII